MSIKLWFELVSVCTMVILAPFVYKIYSTGKKYSEPKSSLKDCISNGINHGTLSRAVICSMIVSFFGVAGFVFIFIFMLVSPSATQQVAVKDLHGFESHYWYDDAKLGCVTISSNTKVDFIRNELESNPNGYYDIITIKEDCVDVSFSELFDYYFSTRPVNELGIKYNCSVDRHTGSLSVQGVLKTDVEDDKVVYRIGNYSLHGKDEKGIISSLANNTEVHLVIIYDTTTDGIEKYKILSAKTI